MEILVYGCALVRIPIQTHTRLSRITMKLWTKNYWWTNFVRLNLLWLLSLYGCSPNDAPVASYKIASHSLLSAAYSRDATQYFVGTINHGGSLWKAPGREISRSERLFDWNHTSDEFSAIRVAVFSADGRFVATTEGSGMVVWSTETGQSDRYWQSPSRIIDLDISSGGEYALLALDDQSAVLFNLMRGGIVGKLQHQETISGVAINDEATLAITGANDGVAKIWSLEDGEPQFELNHKTPVNYVALSPSGAFAVTAAYQGPVSVWDTKTGNQIVRLYRVNPGITSLRFSEDENLLLIGTARESIHLMARSSGEMLKHWKIPNDGPWHKAAVIAVSFGAGAEAGQNDYHAISSSGFAYTLAGDL